MSSVSTVLVSCFFFFCFAFFPEVSLLRSNSRVRGWNTTAVRILPVVLLDKLSLIENFRPERSCSDQSIAFIHLWWLIPVVGRWPISPSKCMSRRLSYSNHSILIRLVIQIRLHDNEPVFGPRRRLEIGDICELSRSSKRWKQIRWLT